MDYVSSVRIAFFRVYKFLISYLFIAFKFILLFGWKQTETHNFGGKKCAVITSYLDTLFKLFW